MSACAQYDPERHPPLPEGFRVIPNLELIHNRLPMDGMYLGVEDLKDFKRVWKPSEERGDVVHWINRAEYVYITAQPAKQMVLAI